MRTVIFCIVIAMARLYVAKSVMRAEEESKPSLLVVQRGGVIGRGHTGATTDALPDAARPQTHVKRLMPTQKR